MAEKGLGGGHAHLDTGTDVEDVGHQAPERALRPVGDPQQPRRLGGIGKVAAPLLLHRQGRQGVGRLPRLGDTDGEGVGHQGRRCVPEFTGVVHRRGEARQLLQQIGTHLGRVAAGAAGQDLDALDPLVHRIVEGQGHQGLLRQVARHPQGRRFRLLVDLLEHEVAKAALVGHVLGAAQQAGGALHPGSVAVVELDAQGCEQRDLTVFQGQDCACETCQGGGVAAAEEFPFPQADQQRRLPAGHHQRPRSLGPDQRQRVGPMQAGQNVL